MPRHDHSVNNTIEERSDRKSGNATTRNATTNSAETSAENRLSRLFNRLSPLQRSLISALAGFMFYGAWAFWANHEHGPMLALKAGCVQGSYSFALTFCMTLLLEVIFQFNARMFNHQSLINWLTIAVCCALIFTSSWLINVVAQTPEIFRTVILGYVIGSIYSILYVRGLAKAME